MDDLIMLAPMIPSVEEALSSNFNIHKYWEADDKDGFLAGQKDTRFIATNQGCSGEIMQALPALKLISSFGVGYDSVNVDVAKKQNIKVTNTPDVLTDAVSELTLGLMLSLCRRIVASDKHVRDGRWLADGAYPLTGELTGATVGILGLGRIGKEIAQRCQAFRMRVVYHGRTEQKFSPYPYYASLEEMAKEVDWLVAVVPGGAETSGLIDRKVMQALGPKGSLVNLGRGSLIDEPVMIEMLKSGELGAAALDVYAEEPKMSEELWAMENVVLSPHSGSATTKTRWAMGDLVVRNLLAYQAGKPLISPVV